MASIYRKKGSPFWFIQYIDSDGIRRNKSTELRADNPTVSFYRYLYNTVGEPWLWYERRAFDDATLLQMFADDFVDIFAVHIGVPGFFRINDQYRPELAAVQAASHVDAHAPGTRKSKRLDAALGVFAYFRRTVIVAARLAAITLIAAEKNVVLKKTHGVVRLLESARVG